MKKVQPAPVLGMEDRSHFQSMKKLEVFLCPLDGMLIHRRLPVVTPRHFVRAAQQFSGGWREEPRPGLKPRRLEPTFSALTLHNRTPQF